MTLDELIRLDVEEILTTPLLRQSVLSYARHLFNGDNPVAGCDTSVHYYFLRLQKEGIEKQQKLLNMKYSIFPKDSILVHNGQVYNSSSLTDEVAEDYLEKFPRALGKSIVINKDAVAAPKQVPQKTEKEKLTERATELGIDAKGLSVNKLKDAIASKELELQKQKREELILKAIELEIEHDEEIPTEELEALIAEKEAAQE